MKCKKLIYSLISLIIFKYIIDEILNNFFLYILSSTLISRLISRYLQKTIPYKKNAIILFIKYDVVTKYASSCCHY